MITHTTLVFATEKKVLPQLFYHEMWYKHTTIKQLRWFSVAKTIVVV